MKLFKILLTHYAPKDSETAIKEFIVAEDDKQVFEYLKNGYTYWSDIENDGDLETLKEIFNDKGDNREVYDLYYGATQFSWKEVELIDDSVILSMIKNGLAKQV